ncbi:uncharacterized protein PgNI_09238 [Pyricularia grisea]|uniref:Rhodopsin domain-containing protein n=1 Tax=Pyricularia grisea TaxID=148305 RepID=A0A6P8ATJ0_PYRGI|nr:uncharacterized protein PgNI_09238 [Pyricularia grisea]TLD05449.1 hypothetical protein PgNI_09238 [Pyricularia grisea]
MDVTPIGTIGGEGHWLLAVSWATTGAAAFCFLMRLYTRLVVIKAYGWDDIIYNASFILLLACTIMVHVSVLYGLGQSQDAIWDDSPDRLTKCLLYLIVAQIFGVSTMGVAKVSLGLFLLRLVTKPWHRWAIWAAIAALLVDTAVCAFAFAFQCTPPAFLWDKTIPGGSCPLPITPFAIALGTGCVLADLFFAVFPCVFVWQLNKPFQERLLIAGSMSLGLAAAACGVKRTIGLGGLQSANYTIDAIPTCAWSIAELAITLVCIAIPVCLPLFRQVLKSVGLTGNEAPALPGKKEDGGENGKGGPVFALRTFGGSDMPGSKSTKSWQRSSRIRDDAESELSLRRSPTEEVRGTRNRSPADAVDDVESGLRTEGRLNDNNGLSDERLGDDRRLSTERRPSPNRRSSIERR